MSDKKFACSFEACGFSATADRMWNLDRKSTGGKLVILCGREAHSARKRGLRAYRLSDTLQRDAERERIRREREEFFERVAFARSGNTRLSAAFKAAKPESGNGHDTAQPT